MDNTLIKKKEFHDVIIALVDRHTKNGFCRYVVAWNYDCDSGTWGQGHYFTDREDAEKYYETEYR